MEFLLPKRFLVLLLVLMALAGGAYLADGQRRAAVMDTVWGLADRVAALIVPGDVESMGGGQAGGQKFAMVPVVTSTFTPPVMSATEYERERAREEMPTATPTATATFTPAPTPTPPPTPEPEPVGTPEVHIEVVDSYLVVTAHVPPVRYRWYEFNVKRWKWEERQVLVSDTIVLETIQLIAQAASAPDVMEDICLPDVCWAEYSFADDGTYMLKVTVDLGANPPVLDPGTRWHIWFLANTAGTTWEDGHTNPRGVVAYRLLQPKGGTP